MTIRECRTLNKFTNLNSFGVIDEEVENMDFYPLVEIDNDGRTYKWDSLRKKPIIDSDKELKNEKENLSFLNSKYHSDFQNLDLPYEIVRDAEVLSYVLKSDDNTRMNLYSAVVVAERKGQVFYYDTYANGYTLTLEEINELFNDFITVLDYSFTVKGQNKQAISTASNKEELEDVRVRITPESYIKI